MIENMEILELDNIGRRMHELADRGYRFVTITCCNNKDGTYDLFYSFDLNLQLVTLKTTVGKDAVIPSVSPIFIAAAFAENEIKELFGLQFNGLALDYGGKFILSQDAPESPFGGGVIIERKDGGKDAG